MFYGGKRLDGSANNQQTVYVMPTSPNGEIILTKQPTFLQAVSAKN
jgi:hypothetical protein